MKNYPIVGVTGHRHLFEEDRETLKRKIRDFFMENFSAEERVYVLSGLAEGADQLAAETVLELKANERPNLKLTALLPMPARFYEEDFEEEGDGGAVQGNSPRKVFYQLMLKADGVVELPLLGENEKLALEQEPINRLLQYDMLGAQLAQNSNFLLALWDGETAQLKAGGTGDVVRRVLTTPGECRVYRIVTPQDRKGKTRPENALEAGFLERWPRERSE